MPIIRGLYHNRTDRLLGEAFDPPLQIATNLVRLRQNDPMVRVVLFGRDLTRRKVLTLEDLVAFRWQADIGICSQRLRIVATQKPALMFSMLVGKVSQ